jgi:hypothetical protein
LYSFSTVGQKIHWMRDNPKVCVEIDEVVDRFTWTSVVLSGLYEELRDREDAARAKARALKLLQECAEWWLPGIARLSSGSEHETPVVPHSDRDDERAPGRAAAQGSVAVAACAGRIDITRRFDNAGRPEPCRAASLESGHRPPSCGNHLARAESTLQPAGYPGLGRAADAVR